jgi:thiol-disulfide isomerase/thioredoxin
MNKLMVLSSITVYCLLLGLTSFQSGSTVLKEEIWRGAFTVSENEIPFLFEVKEKTGASIFLINGIDRFQVKNISYRNDSVFIPFDLYDAVLQCKIENNTLRGKLIKTASGKINEVPFRAEYGNTNRFPVRSENSKFSLSGTWDITMGEDISAEKTVGIFDTKNSILTVSILTTTGDYRFLEGVVHEKNFELSAFGGSTPYLLKGEFTSDHAFSGEFITPRKTTKIKGIRNAKAASPDAFQITRLKDGSSTIKFSFPNIDGKKVSLTDPAYREKVVIVTILGSWCPNCLDENKFLAEWYKTNHQRGVEIIGLGFERKSDFESARKSLSTLKNRLGIEYEILFAGQVGPDAAQALPQLNGIASFPTTIFIDKKGNVRKIHSGFSGPATGKFFEEFKTEFNSLIDSLLLEN